ncbi:MAG: hypothetical protein IPN76_06700 [Saprospiraceae bacterium]|nr:hypothetical protein [Saprospiraceae bacterium]
MLPQCAGFSQLDVQFLLRPDQRLLGFTLRNEELPLAACAVPPRYPARRHEDLGPNPGRQRPVNGQRGCHDALFLLDGGEAGGPWLASTSSSSCAFSEKD